MSDTSQERAWEQIRRVVGEDHVRAASGADSIDRMQPAHLVEPESADQIARVLAIADSSGLRVIPRGGGTKIDWGHPPRGVEIILSTALLNRVLEHAAADMTATVQAGCTIASFQKHLAEKGQRLAVDPLWPDRATIGGVLAANDSGPLRATFGSIRDHLIGITVALPDGTLARSGGKVVKNVAGYDLPKLFIGSFGTLGMITEATFRLYPLPKCSRTLGFSIPSAEILARTLWALADCCLITAAVQIETSDATPARISTLIEGLPDAMEHKLQRVTSAAGAAGAHHTDPEAAPFSANQTLLADSPCVCRLSMLPSRIPAFIEYLRVATSARGLRWRLVMQAVGVGLLSLDLDSSQSLPEWIQYLRQHLGEFNGSLTILRCTTDLKNLVDSWPHIGDALPLMQRIKRQFDPNNTLAAGRFVGGI